MNIGRLFTVLKKSAGEARWSRYPSWNDKFEIFKVLLRLRFYSEVLPSHPTVVTQNIFEYKVTGLSYRELLYLFREIFLDHQYSFNCEHNEPKILDCGANIGMAILFFKKKFPKSKILAFEPNPLAFACLKKNVEDNLLENVEVINSGLSGETGTITFYTDKGNSLISSINMDRGGKDNIVVNMVKLSDFLQHRQFDFAKIDIEGAEWEVITDLKNSNTLANVHQYIFEYHHNLTNVSHRLSEFLLVFDQLNFEYNLRASFQEIGDFQDVSIHFYQK